MTMYVVSGFKRSGTSLMMRLLETAGIECVYYPFNEKELKERKAPKNEYFYECQLSMRGFYEKEIPFLDGKAFKTFSFAIREIPKKADVKIIYMERNIQGMFESLRKMYSGDELIRQIVSYRMFKLTDKDEWLLKKTLRVSFDKLLSSPEEELKKVSEFIGIKMDTPNVIKEIKNNEVKKK